MVNTRELQISSQRKLKEWWPSIYQFINGTVSYLFVEARKVAIDVFGSLTGRQ